MTDDLTRRMALLEAQAAELDPQSPSPAPASVTGGGPELGPVHTEVLAFLDSMVALTTGADTGGMAGVLLATLRRARPYLVDSLRKVPEEGLVDFLTDLRARIDAVFAKIHDGQQ